jgi:S-formylglutathione hydrolase FrmB
MLRATKHFFLLLALVSVSIAQLPQLKDADFLSQSLGRRMRYRILLPASYESSKQSYPVLYLLHGLYGDYKNWTDKTDVTKYLGGADLIIVMPDANDSWYTNWATDPQQKYEDYIVKDLVSEIESHYRTTTTRESRWIAGLSMGGYGAIKFGLRYPQLFSMVASFSGALNPDTKMAVEHPAFAPQLMKVYGPNTSATRASNDIYKLAEKIQPSTTPYLFLTCGTNDPFLSSNREFVAPLPAQHIRYEYHELPGAHSWEFWDHSIQLFFSATLPKLAH